MKIFEFLNREGQFTISAEDVQKLNENFSETSVRDLPKEKADDVYNYLIAALNQGSVEPNIKAKIEHLVSELQEIRELHEKEANNA